METRPPVLVTALQSALGLASVWSLAKLGVPCFGLSNEPDSPCLKSRFLKGFLVLPFRAREGDPREYVQRINEYCLRHGIQEILCHQERQMLVFHQYRSELDASIRLLFPSQAVLERAVDKHKLLAEAANLGINVPKSRVVRTRAELEDATRTMEYPLIVKIAGLADIQLDPAWTFKVLFLENPSQIKPLLESFRDTATGFLVQEYVTGRYLGMGMAMQNGQLRAAFQWTAIREYQPGLGSLRVSLAPLPRLVEDARRLLAHIGYDGVCEVEFRGSLDGKKVYLMEVNPRLWGGVRLAVRSGVDFPSLAYRIYRGETVETLAGYQVGVYCRALAADIRWFIGGAVLGNYQRVLPNLRMNRLEVIANFIRNRKGADVYDLENLDDPLPMLYDYLEKAARPLKFVAKAFTKP